MMIVLFGGKILNIWNIFSIIGYIVTPYIRKSLDSQYFLHDVTIESMTASDLFITSTSQWSHHHVTSSSWSCTTLFTVIERLEKRKSWKVTVSNQKSQPSCFFVFFKS